jgi:RHS repeat-associated protein
MDAADPLSLTGLTDTVTVNGKTFKSIFNAASGTTAHTSAAGRQSASVFDATGRLIQSQRAELLPVDLYDAQRRLAAMVQGSGEEKRETSFAYNEAGYLETVTDPLGRTHGYAYDASGRVVREVFADNRETLYSYDANGNLTSLTPPGRPAHLFRYTAVDETAEYEPPDAGAAAGATLYAYNLDRDLVSVTRPDGQSVSLSYDGAGRLSALTLPTGTLAYSYSSATGKLTGVTDPVGGSLAYSYSGALPTKTAWTGAVAGSVGFAYNSDFRVSAVSLNGSDPVSYQYDSDGLLTKAGSLTLSRSAANGLLTGTALGVVIDSHSYNSFGETTSYEATVNGTSLVKIDYLTDKLGRIVGRTETQGSAVSSYTYGYDEAGRLVEVQLNGEPLSSYAYDANGNRLSYHKGSETTEGTYDDQDRLLTYGNASYAYSPNGELASRTVGTAATTYSYDVLGNLRRVVLPNGRTIDYVIDAANRRIGKKADGALVQAFLYQDQLKPVAELDGSGAVLSRFVYATRSNVPDYLVRDGVLYRIITDHLGSPRFVVNTADGSIAQQMDYDPFGNVTMDTNAGFQPFGFAGGLYDRDAGLVRLGTRDYDPQTGRWTVKDPILFAGGDINLYGYVQNDPVNWTDPEGLQRPYPGDTGPLSMGPLVGGGIHGSRPPSLTPFGAGRSGAFNAAKRSSGIPTSQQPCKVRKVPDRTNPGKTVREYDFEVPQKGGGSEIKTIYDHQFGHSYPDDPTQNRGPHFNDQSKGHYDY